MASKLEAFYVLVDNSEIKETIAAMVADLYINDENVLTNLANLIVCKTTLINYALRRIKNLFYVPRRYKHLFEKMSSQLTITSLENTRTAVELSKKEIVKVIYKVCIYAGNHPDKGILTEALQIEGNFSAGMQFIMYAYIEHFLFKHRNKIESFKDLCQGKISEGSIHLGIQ